MRALVAWRGGLFLTEGKIFVLSVSSLFLTQVGGYVCDHATKYQGDTAITIPPFFQNAGRGTERIWGETLPSPQPLVINWPGLNDKEKLN